MLKFLERNAFEIMIAEFIVLIFLVVLTAASYRSYSECYSFVKSLQTVNDSGMQEYLTKQGQLLDTINKQLKQ